ncbi:DUF934 domain-containing protein [Massilia yuzhufengensis]|uniref:Uncharacterized conserved protein, DUF934 family n=1 Tax=Massilia yuzhufengensis TaxID=1164594 RepID=A0A1I1K861_9BURK|nr:DUF934 domain-containing protein [Massilia yuzhufengensis]SFC56741.1 Uncharacterized conserved protein, DUF934 family [Massilia yuzhufengensis]
MPNFILHKQIIKGREVVDDDWSVLRLVEGETPDAVAVPEGKVIVPLAVWQAQRDVLAQRAQVGLWFAPDEQAADVKDELGRFAVIAIDFPKFSDGRGYSIAFNLRKRLGYSGELRAIGDVLRDQLWPLSRVGFDAYATRQDRSIHDALKGLTVFSETYQASVDQPEPLFRRAPRGTPPEHTDLGAGI